jgi:hypothetical protein
LWHHPSVHGAISLGDLERRAVAGAARATGHTIDAVRWRLGAGHNRVRLVLARVEHRYGHGDVFDPFSVRAPEVVSSELRAMLEEAKATQPIWRPREHI